MESFEVKDVAIGCGAGVVGVLFVCFVAQLVGINQTISSTIVEYAVGFALGICFYILRKAKRDNEKEEDENE